jgi:hypothetical protein
MIHPLKTEHDFAQHLYTEQKVAEWIAAGKLSAEGIHNTIRPSVWGIKRHVTNLPQEGAGRSWPGPIPEQYASYPTIEIPAIEVGSSHIVRDFVSTLSEAGRTYKRTAASSSARSTRNRTRNIPCPISTFWRRSRQHHSSASYSRRRRRF